MMTAKIIADRSENMVIPYLHLPKWASQWELQIRDGGDLHSGRKTALARVLNNGLFNCAIRLIIDAPGNYPY